MVLRFRDLAAGDCCLGEASARLTVVSSKEGSAATPEVLFLRTFLAFLAGFAVSDSMDGSLASAREGASIFKRMLLLAIFVVLGAVDNLRSVPGLAFALLGAAPSDTEGKPAEEGRCNVLVRSFELVLSATAGNAAPRLAVGCLIVLSDAVLFLLRILPRLLLLVEVALLGVLTAMCSSVSKVPVLPSSTIVLCTAPSTILP